MAIELLVACGMGAFVVSSLHSSPAQAYGVGFFGVGGRLAPASLPPYGDGDVQNFGVSCTPIVTITGPEGTSWGAYQWGVAEPYDYWFQSYETNGYPYTHANEFMLGTAIFPNPNPFCPLPLLTSIGDSLFKAGF